MGNGSVTLEWRPPPWVEVVSFVRHARWCGHLNGQVPYDMTNRVHLDLTPQPRMHDIILLGSRIPDPKPSFWPLLSSKSWKTKRAPSWQLTRKTEEIVWLQSGLKMWVNRYQVYVKPEKLDPAMEAEYYSSKSVSGTCWYWNVSSNLVVANGIEGNKPVYKLYLGILGLCKPTKQLFNILIPMKSQKGILVNKAYTLQRRVYLIISLRHFWWWRNPANHRKHASNLGNSGTYYQP